MRQMRYRGLAIGFVLSTMLPFKALAATSINLRQQPSSSAASLSMVSSQGPRAEIEYKQISTVVDNNQTSHIRLQQMFEGIPVWGGNAIKHVPKQNTKQLSAANKSTMSGTVYQGLSADLKMPSSMIFTARHEESAIAKVLETYKQKFPSAKVSNQSKVEKAIFVDEVDHIGHYAYIVKLYAQPLSNIPQRPIYIIDALNGKIYKTWDDIKTISPAPGGGFGGNLKLGKLVYDGLANHLSKLAIDRDASKNICYLQNDDVTVTGVDFNFDLNDWVTTNPIEFPCNKTNSEHDHVYWSGDFDAVNGGYSPSNDALYLGKVIKDMYQEWYGIPVLAKEGKPMTLVMRVHAKEPSDWNGNMEPMENAFWDPVQMNMTFGDGQDEFYPLVSLGVAAHEISHGFTQQSSDLQIGWLHESFSDMAAQAADYYVYGTNTWQVAPEVFKRPGEALRYMDDPKKDGASIDHVKDFQEGMDPHLAAGVFNKAFYLMAISPNWNTRKAFEVMINANRFQWKPVMDFTEAACGVVDAAKALDKDKGGYDLETISKAFKTVGISVSGC